MIYQWYRRKEFHKLIEAVQNKGIFESFTRRITYGSSMGGYAASAYASLLNADLAVLINPISTLNKEKSGFETRFKRAKLADWTGLYHDGVLGLKDINSYIVYDPLLWSYILAFSIWVVSRYLNLVTELKRGYRWMFVYI